MTQLAHGHGGHAGATGHDAHDAHDAPTDHRLNATGNGHGSGHDGDGDAKRADGLDSDLAYASADEAHVSPESVDPNTGFFLEKLLAHEREGFLWQKPARPAATTTRKQRTRATTNATGCRSSPSMMPSAKR